jgi:hypothetical protein
MTTLQPAQRKLQCEARGWTARQRRVSQANPLASTTAARRRVGNKGSGYLLRKREAKLIEKLVKSQIASKRFPPRIHS